MRALLLCLLLPFPAIGQTRLRPEDVPTFQLRAKVTSAGKASPEGKKFSFRYGVPSRGVDGKGDAWSDWLVFGKEQVEATLKGYPAIYMRGYPLVVRLVVGGVVDPTHVEAELKFDETGEVFPFKGELYGPNLGILIYREEKKPLAATMAQYNRRYWKHLDSVKLREQDRPKHFPIVDRFIGGDDDRIAWKEGIENLARGGFNTIMLPPSAKLRELLLSTGLKKTSWAVYNPPGYAFDFDPKITPESIQDWAGKQARPFLDAGYAKEDMAVFAMSDEPGWYFPKIMEDLKKHPAAVERFRSYLKDQKLTPEEVGAKKWDEVLPLGRSGVKKDNLPSHRLFYWTMRFFAHDSSRHFAVSTKALEKAFYPGLPVLTNWNFFAGRMYVPGAVANNPDKKSPDAAMGGHDWLEFGGLRGGTLLWTEDWFGDNRAYQWSYYCARLRSAARRGGVEFGGYVIPRTAGDREDGILQRILTIPAHGGKVVKYFVFGPEYNFPGNCYSERARVLPKMAEAHRMIAAAEHLLWPGRPPKAKVAILFPRSAQMWDAKEQEVAKGISDATNANLNAATVDYLAEVFNLYLALQHSSIPVDFVDEDDLTPEKLRDVQVLYVTAPNISVEGQKGLVEWVKGGGTLVTVSGAGQFDRYDSPCDVLAKGTGIQEGTRQRVLIQNAALLKEVAALRTKSGRHSLYGARGTLPSGKTFKDEEVPVRFEDGTPSMVSLPVGKGRALHYFFLPGLSYWRSSKTTSDKLPVGFDVELRDLIRLPVMMSKVVIPVGVSLPMVEACVVESEKGMAITILNWTGEVQKSVALSVHCPRDVKVRSILHGALGFATREEEGDRRIIVDLPRLGAADILLLE